MSNGPSDDHYTGWAGVSGTRRRREWTFDEWTAHLRAAGFRLCPGSFAVPVELRGLRPDGFGFHLRCRGVRVTLALFRPGRALWQVPFWDPKWSPEEGLSLWVNQRVDPPQTGYRAFGHPGLAEWDLGHPAVGSRQWTHGDVPDGARLVFDRDEIPDHQAVFDGGRECGWGGHEAGSLRPAAAAVLFARLMAEADATSGAGREPVLVPRARVEEPNLAVSTAE